jgi:antitoxin HicB
MMDKFYPIVVVQMTDADGGGFMGYVPDLKGCMSHGDTPADAIDSAREAALEWIEEAKAQGFAIPEPGHAAAAVKREREQLFSTIKQQSEAIEKMSHDIQKFESDFAALNVTVGLLTERLSMENPYASLLAHQKIEYEEIVAVAH